MSGFYFGINNQQAYASINIINDGSIMAKAKKLSLHDVLFFDRMLLVSLVLTATAYIFQHDWVEPIFSVGALFTGVLWSYRTATNHHDRFIRVGAATIFSMLAVICIIYLAQLQGKI
jgi:hypothetical protein